MKDDDKPALMDFWLAVHLAVSMDNHSADGLAVH